MTARLYRSLLVICYVLFAVLRAFLFIPLRHAGFLRYTDKFISNFYRSILLFGGVIVEVEGLENADPDTPYVIVSNHQSMLDIPVVGAVFPGETRIITKQELRRVPIFGRTIGAYGFTFIDRRNKKKAVAALRHAAETLAEYSIIIFPEGTRSPDGTVGKFKTGGISLAQKAGVPVLPMAISGTADLLGKGTSLMRGGTVRVRIFPPVDVSGDRPKHETATDIEQKIRDFTTI